MTSAESLPGLRERKKARTRLEIQRQALHLFRVQGFDATTVEQVAAAAEVAPSTVFRYFVTKESLLVLDEFHSLRAEIAAALAAQSAELSPVQALRAAVRQAMSALPADEHQGRQERDLSMVAVPEVLSANVGLIGKAARALTVLVAEREGRNADDPRARALTAAFLGVTIDAVVSWSAQPELQSLAGQVDEALGHLEDALRN